MKAFRGSVTLLALSALLSACASDARPSDDAGSLPVAAIGEADATDPGPGSDGGLSGGECAAGDAACRERLDRLEETLAAYEAGVTAVIDGEAQACWLEDRRAFRQRIDACTDSECRAVGLLERIAALHDLQAPERRSSLPLPESPSLVAVLAPEDDAGDGMPAAGGGFEVRGGLIHAGEHPEHMGIAVWSGEGRSHVFIPDMFIGGRAGHDEVLGLVGTSPTAKVLVRGHPVVAPTGVSNFDPARCRWVYHLP